MNINLTLLFQVLFFAVFVWFSKKFVWAPIMGALNTRKATIADGLASAEKGHLAEEEGRRQAEGVIAEAKVQATEIINRASSRAAELVDEAKDNARSEGARITASARADIDTELSKARETLRAQVGELAVAGARQILRREIDADAHAELLDGLAARL